MGDKDWSKFKNEAKKRGAGSFFDWLFGRLFDSDQVAQNLEVLSVEEDEEVGFEVVKGDPQSPPIGVQNFSIDFSDGPGGNLYKPKGDHSNEPVILLREGLIAVSVSIRNMRSGSQFNFHKSPSGEFSNGNRQTWRSGQSIQQIRKLLGRGSLEIVVKLPDGRSDSYEMRGLKKRID